MTFHIHRSLTAVALFAGLAISISHTPTSAADYSVGDIKISNPWTRATPKGARIGGGFMTITNTGREPDRLVGGSVVVSPTFEVHEMKMDGGIMRMRALADGLEIKPGATVELKPGSYHVMMIGLKDQLVEGGTVKGTLEFKNAGTVEIAYKVGKLGSRNMPGHDMKGHGDMKGHDMKGHGDMPGGHK